ncbi:MAG: hypothetical protein ABSB76_07005 [Streptosporangiaceae bacterium]
MAADLGQDAFGGQGVGAGDVQGEERAGRDHSGCPAGSGPESVTSNAARSRPEVSSVSGAAVSMIGGAWSRIRPRKCASTMPQVPGVSGTKMITMSARASALGYGVRA